VRRRNYAGGMADGAVAVPSVPEPDRSALAVATVELEVAGMHCPSCVALIEDTLGRDPGVETVTVDLETGRASVVYDARAISVDDMCAVVAGAGYGARAVSGDPAS